MVQQIRAQCGVEQPYRISPLTRARLLGFGQRGDSPDSESPPGTPPQAGTPLRLRRFLRRSREMPDGSRPDSPAADTDSDGETFRKYSPLPAFRRRPQRSSKELCGLVSCPSPILLQPTPLRPAVTAEPSPLSNDALSKRASRDGHP